VHSVAALAVLRALVARAEGISTLTVGELIEDYAAGVSEATGMRQPCSPLFCRCRAAVRSFVVPAPAVESPRARVVQFAHRPAGDCRVCLCLFPGAWSRSDGRKEAVRALGGALKEPVADVRAAAAYVRDKNLPVGCFSMNGALTVGLDMGQSLNNVIYQVRRAARCFQIDLQCCLRSLCVLALRA
jgi:hypothetical protein